MRERQNAGCVLGCGERVVRTVVSPVVWLESCSTAGAMRSVLTKRPSRATLFAGLCAVTSGCAATANESTGADSGPPADASAVPGVCDPNGTWALTYDWSSGSCAANAEETLVLTVDNGEVQHFSWFVPETVRYDCGPEPHDITVGGDVRFVPEDCRLTVGWHYESCWYNERQCAGMSLDLTFSDDDVSGRVEREQCCLQYQSVDRAVATVSGTRQR